MHYRLAQKNITQAHASKKYDHTHSSHGSITYRHKNAHSRNSAAVEIIFGHHSRISATIGSSSRSPPPNIIAHIDSSLWAPRSDIAGGLLKLAGSTKALIDVSARDRRTFSANGRVSVAATPGAEAAAALEGPASHASASQTPIMSTTA